jgi:excisionase family DNA binding protein
MQIHETVEIIGGLMTVMQVAAYLGIQKSTVYSLSMKAKIPHFHIGKLLRFRKDDIDAWLTDTGCDGKGRES